MASVFWDTHGVILIDYLEKGRTITITISPDLARSDYHLFPNHIVREPTANIWIDKITGQILLGNVVYMLKNNNPRAANVVPPALYALTNC